MIICQVYFLSQYHSNAQYIIARRTHVLKTHTLHNRAWQRMNQIIKTTVQCVHHSLEPQPSVCTAFSLSRHCANRLVDDLLVKILQAVAHSVLEIIQIGNRNVIHALLQSPHTA